MKTLKHDDNIRLANWNIEVANVCTLVGFHSKYESDKKKIAERVAHSRSQIAAGREGFAEVFATFAGHVISADPSFHRRDKARHHQAIVVEDGEVVKVDKKKYRIQVAAGCKDYPRYSNPFKFVPVK